MTITNPILFSVLAAGLIAQLMKVVVASIKKRQLLLKPFLNMGGMPSGHSATVSSLTVSAGMVEGFNSNIFFVVLVFAMIIMYDAMGVRRAAGRHGKILNKILNVQKIKHKRLREELGHSPLEVFIGAIIGVLCAVYFTLL